MAPLVVLVKGWDAPNLAVGIWDANQITLQKHP